MFLNGLFLFTVWLILLIVCTELQIIKIHFVHLIHRINSFHFVVFFSQDLRVKLEHEREKRWVGTFSLFLQLSVLSLISFLSSYPSSRYAISKISLHGEEQKTRQAAQKSQNVPIKVFWHLDGAFHTHSGTDGGRGKRRWSQVFELNGTPNINFQCPVGHSYTHTQNMSFFPSQDCQMPTPYKPNVLVRYSWKYSIFPHIKPMCLHRKSLWFWQSFVYCKKVN